MNKITIAVDGYSSCGKSTLAKALARKIQYSYIDTGAMYRAVTLYFLRENISFDAGSDFFEDVLDRIHIHFEYNPDKSATDIFLNTEDVEDEIRLMPVSENVSKVSALKAVRKRMVHLQRQMGQNKGVVMDGRDIGSVVFPDAELKLFMTAAPEVRAQRRFDELKAKGIEITMQEVIMNIETRDFDDTHRCESPLVKAPDAIVIDNTQLDKETQLARALSLAYKRM